MKIIVPIATRGRPMRLAGVLHSLNTLSSGRNLVDYVVRIDSDDNETYRIMAALKSTFGCRVIVGPRPVTLAQSWNECVADQEWDACAIMADKHLCLTRHWDDYIRIVLSERKEAGCRWHLVETPEETALILSRKWYDLKKQVLPEHFPFWFAERWQMEVHMLAFENRGVPLVVDMPLSEPRLKTQGLRDLEFWFDFFAKTRPIRVREALELAFEFGWTKPVDTSDQLREMEKADALQIPRIPLYYQTRGEASEDPSEQYMEARKRAENLLATLNSKEDCYAM